MEQIKLGLRIASIVVGIICYSSIWMWVIRNCETNEKTRNDFITWILMHIVVVIFAFLWAWN